MWYNVAIFYKLIRGSTCGYSFIIQPIFTKGC